MAFLEECTSKYKKKFPSEIFCHFPRKESCWWTWWKGEVNSTNNHFFNNNNNNHNDNNSPIILTADDFDKIIKEHTKSTNVLVTVENKISRTNEWDHTQPNLDV